MKKKLKLSEMSGVLLVFIGIILATGAEHPAMSITQILLQAGSGIVMIGIGAWLIKKENP